MKKEIVVSYPKLPKAGYKTEYQKLLLLCSNRFNFVAQIKKKKPVIVKLSFGECLKKDPLRDIRKKFNLSNVWLFYRFVKEYFRLNRPPELLDHKELEFEMLSMGSGAVVFKIYPSITTQGLEALVKDIRHIVKNTFNKKINEKDLFMRNYFAFIDHEINGLKYKEIYDNKYNGIGFDKEHSVRKAVKEIRTAISLLKKEVGIYSDNLSVKVFEQ